MLKITPVFLWALLTAAPVFSQQALWSDPHVTAEGVKWFLLAEGESEVRSRLGQPTMVVDFGAYRSWQYQIGEVEHDDFSHALVFRKSDGKLVSISHTYTVERNVDEFFPVGETTTHWFRTEGQPAFAMRVRRLPGERVLIAIGTSKPGQTTGQVVLMRESELRNFYPSLDKDLAAPAAMK